MMFIDEAMGITYGVPISDGPVWALPGDFDDSSLDDASLLARLGLYLGSVECLGIIFDCYLMVYKESNIGLGRCYLNVVAPVTDASVWLTVARTHWLNEESGVPMGSGLHNVGHWEAVCWALQRTEELLWGTKEMDELLGTP